MPRSRAIGLPRRCSRSGQEIFLVAVGWQIYELTNSALSLGLIGLAQFLPLFLLALPAGHVADNFDRRHITFVCQLAKFVAVALLAAGTLLVAVLWIYWFPALWKIDRLVTHDDEAELSNSR